MRRLPGPAGRRLSEGGQHSGGSLRIVSGLAENTNSIICDSSSELEAANGCPVLQDAGTTSREAHVRTPISASSNARSHKRAQQARAFLLTLTYMDAGNSNKTHFRCIWGLETLQKHSLSFVLKLSVLAMR